MGEKKATRAAYGDALVELAEQYPNMVVLDADLTQATMTKFFAAKYPERFFNCGIAEANMTGIAAGLSTCGLIPLVNSFAIFSAGRAFEQVRNSVAYPHLNVKIVGSHGGPSVGEDGATHQMNEDLALMRMLPGMVVLVPCDAYEMRQAVEAMLRYEGPCYLRMCRYPSECVTDAIPGYSFEIGKAATLREGSDVTVIACGITVQMALQAADLLAGEGVSVRVLDMHTVKPLDGEAVLKAAKETGCIVTVEEASTLGGLGGAVCEFVSENCPVPVLRHGVPDVFGRSGTAAAVLDYFGLNAEGIAEKVRAALAKK